MSKYRVYVCVCVYKMYLQHESWQKDTHRNAGCTNVTYSVAACP